MISSTCRILTHEPLLVHAALNHVGTQEALLRVKVARHGHRLSGQRALPLVVLNVLLVPVESGFVGENANIA